MNLRITNLYLIIWFLNTVTENNAFITQPDHKDNPVSLKSLQSVNETTSDVTLNLIKSLCSCLREKLKKHKTFNGETNMLLSDDEAGQESDIDFYKNIYNRTCADLHQASHNINSEIVKGNKEAVLNQDLQDDVDSIKQYQRLTRHPRKKEYRLLYNALIKGINNHTYKIQKYPLYKHNITFNSEDKRSVIVIITLLPLLNNSILQQSFYSVTENEVNQTLNTNSLVDIHIIDSMFTNKYERISPVKKCHLYSLYIFITESGRKNFINNFKLLRVKGTIKLYIDVLSNLNLENFPDQCCDKSLLSLCKNRINSEKNEFTDKDQIKYMAQQPNVTNFKNIISKIKNLINLYNAKIIQEDNPNEKLLSKNCNETQYFYEKTNASRNTLSNIDTGIPSVPQNSTTTSETTKGLDFGEYSLLNNTSSQNTTAIKDDKPNSYSTTTIITRLKEENIKTKIVQNLRRNVTVGKNSREIFTEKTLLRNLTIDSTRIKIKNLMNFSIEHNTNPTKIAQSVYNESRTTKVPQIIKKILNMQNIQMFPTVLLFSSTASYKINDTTYNFLKTETINATGNTSINVPNTTRGTYQEENIQPKANINKWSSYTLYTLADHSTGIYKKKISQANRTLDLSVTRDKNKSRIPADLENHTIAVTLSRATNKILQNRQTTTPNLSTALNMANKEHKKQIATNNKPLSITHIVTSTKNKITTEPTTPIGKTEKAMLMNQIDLLLTKNETKTKISFPVRTTQFVSSTELKNHTTMNPISKAMYVKLHQAQILQMVTPNLSKASYITNEENQTQVNLNLFQPLKTYDITNIENKSVIFPNTKTKTPQSKNFKQQILDNETSKSKVGDYSISEANILFVNQKVDFFTTIEDNKTGIDLSASPIQCELLKETENHITVQPLLRETDLKFQSVQMIDTEKSTLLTKPCVTTEEHKIQDINKSTPSSTTPIITMTKNKQITILNRPIGTLQKETLKPTTVENAISTLIMEDNSTEVLRENTLLSNQTSPLFITKNAYRTSNFLVTPALDVLQPIQVSAKHNDTEQLHLNKILRPTRNNQATLSSKIPTELHKYKLDETVKTSSLPNEIEKYLQKDWLSPSNRTLLTMINLNNISDSEITTHLITTQVIPSQTVSQNLSLSTTNFKISSSYNKSKTTNNFSESNAPIVSENDVMKSNLNNLVITTTRLLNTAKFNHFITLLNHSNILTSNDPLGTVVHNRTSLPRNALSSLSELLTDSTIRNQIESSPEPSVLKNRAIFIMDKKDKQMEENADNKNNHVFKYKNRSIAIRNHSTLPETSYLVTGTADEPFLSQTDTNTIYPLSALPPATQVLNKTLSDNSYPCISKNEYLQQKNTFDVQEQVTQILKHNKKLSQTIVPTDDLLSKITTPKLIKDKNRLPRVKINNFIDQSKTKNFSKKFISTKLHQPKTYIVKPKYNKLTTPIILKFITQKLNKNLNKSTSKDWLITKNFYFTKEPTILWSQNKNDAVNIIENVENNSTVITTTPERTSNRNDTLSNPINTEMHNNTNKVRIDLSITPVQSRVSIDPKNHTIMMSHPRATNKNFQPIQNITTATPTLCTAYYKTNGESLKARKFPVRNNLKEIYTEKTFSWNQTFDLFVSKKNFNKSNLIETNNHTKSPTIVTTVQVLVKDIEQPTVDPLRNTNNYVAIHLINKNSVLQNLDQVTPYITNLQNKRNNKIDKVTKSDGVQRQKPSSNYSPGSFHLHAPYTQRYSSTQSKTTYESMFRHPSKKNILNGKSPQFNQKLTTEISNAAVRNKTHKLKLLTQNLTSTPTQNIHRVIFSPQGNNNLKNLFKTTVSGQNFAVPLSEVIDNKLMDTHIIPTPSSKMNGYQRGYLLHMNKLQSMLSTDSSTNKEDEKNTLHDTILDTTTVKKQYTLYYVTQKNYHVSEKQQIHTIKTVLNNVRNKMTESITYKSPEKCIKNITEVDSNKMKIVSNKNDHKITTIASYQTAEIYDMKTTKLDKPHYTTLKNQLKTNQVTTNEILPLLVKDSEVKLTKFVRPYRLENFLTTLVSLKSVPYTKKPISSKSIFGNDAKGPTTTASTQLKIPINKMLKRNNKEQENEINEEIMPILHEQTTFSSNINKVKKMQPLDKQTFFTLSVAFRLPNKSTENTEKLLTTKDTARSKQSKFPNAHGLQIPFPMHNSTTLNHQFQNQSIYKYSMKEVMKIDSTSSKGFHKVFVTSTHSSTKAYVKNISQVLNEIHPTFSTLFNKVNKITPTETMDTFKAIAPLPTSDALQVEKQASVTSHHLFFNKTKKLDISAVNPTLIKAKEYISSKIFSSPFLIPTIPAPFEKKHAGTKDKSRSTVDELSQSSTFKSNRTPAESLTTLKDDKFMKTMYLKLHGNFTNFKPTIVISLNSDLNFTKPELKMTTAMSAQHSNITYIKVLNKKPLDRVSQYKVKNTTPDLTNLLNKISSENKFTSLPEDNSKNSAISTNIPKTAALTKLTAKRNSNIRDNSAVTTTTLKKQDLTNKSVKRTPQIVSNMNMSSMTLSDSETSSIVTQTQNLPLKKYVPSFNKLRTGSFMIKRNKSSSSQQNLPIIQQATHLRNVQNNTVQQDGQIFKIYKQTRKNFNRSIGLISTIKEKKSINVFEIPTLTKNTSTVMPLNIFQSAPLTIKKGMRTFSVLYTSADYKSTLPSNIQLNKKSQELATKAILTTTPSSKNTINRRLGKNIMKKNIKKNKTLQQNFDILWKNDILSSTIKINPNKYTTLGTKATLNSRTVISTTYNSNQTNKISKIYMTPKTISTTNLISDNHKLFFVESNDTSKLISKSTTPTKYKMHVNENITTKEIDFTPNTSFYAFFENQKLLLLNNISTTETNKSNHTKMITTTQKENNKEGLKGNGYAESTQSLNQNYTHYEHNSTTKYEAYIKDPLQALNEPDLTERKIKNKKGNKDTITVFKNKQDLFKLKLTTIVPPPDKSLKSNETYMPKKKELNVTRLSVLSVSTASMSRYSHKFSTTIFPTTHQVKLLTSSQSIPKFISTNKQIFNNTKPIRDYSTSTTKRDYVNRYRNETLNTTPRKTKLKRLNQIYFISLPKSTNVLFDINKTHYTEQKQRIEINVTDSTKVPTTTAPVIENIVSYVASPQINSNIVKFYQKLNLNTSTGEIPKIFVGFNLTVDFEQNKNNQKYNSTKMFEYPNINKNDQGSYKEHSETVSVIPILTKSTTRLRRKSKTIRYNTYKSMEDDLEITLKPQMSKYKLVKSNKYNNLITPLPGNKIRKTSHVLEKKNVILPSLKKTNQNLLTKYPSKPHRKVMKRILLPNKDKEIIAMDTKGFFTNRKLSVKSNFKEILHKAPISHRTQNIATVKTKHNVIRPIFDKLDGIIKTSRENYKPQPLFFTNNDDFYRKDFKTHHQNEALSRREKVNYIKSFPISSPNVRAETVIDIPMYLPPPNTKSIILRDRINYIRNYLYNTELMKQTQLPMKVFVESTTKDNEPYRDPLWYFRKSGWYEDNFADRTPTTTTTRKPTKRQRRTIFFLSPTVPYNRYF